MQSVTDQDQLDNTKLAEIQQRRLAATARFNGALSGNDLAEIKAAHAELQATNQEAETGRLKLAANIRQKINAQVSNGIIDLQNGMKSPREFEDQIMQLVDMLLERAARM